MNNDIKTENLWLMQGDCLERMKEIESGSVDMILSDLPYGTMDTDGGRKLGINGWDNVIDTDKIMAIANRILRKNGRMILFAQHPLTYELINKAIPNLPFNYSMIWEKDHFANALNAKKAPLNYYEDVLIFSKNHDHLGLHPFESMHLELNHLQNILGQSFLNFSAVVAPNTS